jgi:hypothetical protein
MEKWIGEEDNTSGSYVKTVCDELAIRRGGYLNARKLYRFNSRFGKEYNITDVQVLDHIDGLLEKGDSTELYEYLYGLVIQRFGVIEFIVDIGHVIARERDEGYMRGKKQKQKEIREALGLQ